MLQVPRQQPHFRPPSGSPNIIGSSPNFNRNIPPMQRSGSNNQILSGSPSRSNSNIIRTPNANISYQVNQNPSFGGSRVVGKDGSQKLDINLNISVNNDGTISANTSTGAQQPQQHFPRPSYARQNIQLPMRRPQLQHPSFTGNTSSMNSYRQASPIRQPQIIGGHYPQQIGHQMGQIGHAGYSMPASYGTGLGMREGMMLQSPNRSPHHSPMGHNQLHRSNIHQSNIGHMKSSHIDYDINVHEQRVFCVICSDTYTYSQRQQHLAIHRSRSQLSHNNRINYLIDNYNFDDGPVSRPIVEPEQFNIQYQPNKYILQHETSYATEQRHRPNLQDECIGTDFDEHVNRNRNKNRLNKIGREQAHGSTMNVIHESPQQVNYNNNIDDPHLQQNNGHGSNINNDIYQPEHINLNDGNDQDYQQVLANDYRQYKHQRRGRGDQPIYPANVANDRHDINQGNNMQNTNVSDDHRFNRETLVSDDHSQPRYAEVDNNSIFNNRQTLKSEYNRDSQYDSNYRTNAINESAHNDGSRSSQSRPVSSAGRTTYVAPQPPIRETEEEYRNSLGDAHNDSNFRPTQSTYTKQPNNLNNYNNANNSRVSNNSRASNVGDTAHNQNTNQMVNTNNNNTSFLGSSNDMNNMNNMNNMNKSNMTYRQSQIPFEQILGEKKGNSFYQAKRESDLDIIENNYRGTNQ